MGRIKLGIRNNSQGNPSLLARGEQFFQMGHGVDGVHHHFECHGQCPRLLPVGDAENLHPDTVDLHFGKIDSVLLHFFVSVLYGFEKILKYPSR